MANSRMNASAKRLTPRNASVRTNHEIKEDFSFINLIISRQEKESIHVMAIPLRRSLQEKKANEEKKR